MNIKKIIIIFLIGYIIYLLYNNVYVNEFFKNSIKDKSTIETKNTNLMNDSTLYSDKHVRFNDNIDVFEYSTNDNYSNKDDNILGDEHLNKIVDNLLNEPITVIKNNKKISKSECYDSIINTDKNKMFDEIETFINNKYNEDNKLYNEIEIPQSSNTIINTNEIKNSDINPVINPHCYTNNHLLDDDNLTIWEKYDIMTTNNHKQFNNLKNLEPNNFNSKNEWTIGSNSEYGSKFDNYATF